MWFRTKSPQPEVTDELISTRAYELWQARGCPHGDGSEDWREAKEQLLAETSMGGRSKPLQRLLRRFRGRAA